MVEKIKEEGKFYKVQNVINNNILPGDPKGLPDDYLIFLSKFSDIIEKRRMEKHD